MCKVFGVGLTFLVYVLVARNMGADFLGTYLFGVTLISMLGLLSAFGGPVVILKKISVSGGLSHKKSNLYTSSTILLSLFISSLIALLVFVFGEEFFDNLFEGGGLKEMPVSLCLLIILQPIILIFSEYLKGVGKQLSAVLLSNIYINGFMLLYVAFSFLFKVDLTLGDLFDYQFIVAFLVVITTCYFLFYRSKSVPLTSLVFLKKVLYLGWPVWMANIGGILLSYSDVIILGLFENSEAIGFYAAASKIALASSMLLSVTNSVMAPKFAKYHAADLDLKSLFQKMNNWMLLASIIITTLLIVFADFWVAVYGEGFGQAALVLIILASGQFFNLALGNVGYLLLMTGEEKIFTKIIVITSLFNLALSIVLVKEFHIYGVAISTAICMIIWNLWSAYEVKRRLGFWAYSWR